MTTSDRRAGDRHRQAVADRRRRAAARAADRRRAAAERRRQSAAIDAPRALESPPPIVRAVAAAPTDGQLRLAAVVLIVLALASLGLLVPMRRRWSL